MLNQLLLLSRDDIPFPKAGITIHQPTIKEIGYIGEDAFFSGIQLLNFSKNDLTEEDKTNLKQYTNFDIIMQIAENKDPVAQQNIVQAKMVLVLMFPDYHISFTPKGIILLKDGESKAHVIDNSNFEDLVEIINEMFSLSTIFGDGKTREYDPLGKAAQELADKFKKYHQKLAKMKGSDTEGQKVTILSRYISILTVGEQKDMNSFMEYSVYQLFDEFQRYNLKQQSDMYIQAKMAGAKDLKEVDNWMKDIHSNSDD